VFLYCHCPCIVGLSTHFSRNESEIPAHRVALCGAHGRWPRVPDSAHDVSLGWKQRTHIYADVTGYYVPEFLWWGMEYNEHGYQDDLKHEKMDCPIKTHGIVQLVVGELVEFWGNNGGIHVFHSRLRFPSIKKAWRYVAEHPDETSEWFGGKWVALISLDELGGTFSDRRGCGLMHVPICTIRLQELRRSALTGFWS